MLQICFFCLFAPLWDQLVFPEADLLIEMGKMLPNFLFKSKRGLSIGKFDIFGANLSKLFWAYFPGLYHNIKCFLNLELTHFFDK
jgi:hypothetical protein